MKSEVAKQPARLVLSLPLRERGLKYRPARLLLCLTASLPLRERGLKFNAAKRSRQCVAVAPFAGAWIEMSSVFLLGSTLPSSLPLRERGLKSVLIVVDEANSAVAPFAGAWIEIICRCCLVPCSAFVAPIWGAWIEKTVMNR